MTNELTDNEKQFVYRLKILLGEQSSATSSIKRMEILTEMFVLIIDHPSLLQKRKSFRDAVHQKVKRFIVMLENGSYQHVADNDRVGYDHFAKTLYRLLALSGEL